MIEVDVLYLSYTTFATKTIKMKMQSILTLVGGIATIMLVGQKSHVLTCDALKLTRRRAGPSPVDSLPVSTPNPKPIVVRAPVVGSSSSGTSFRQETLARVFIISMPCIILIAFAWGTNFSY